MSNDRAKLAAKIGTVAAALVVSFVAGKEGTINHTYRDPIGIITACTGHVDPSLRMGTTYTVEQCKDMLYEDLAKHADDLGCMTVPLSDNQKVALLSFSFNVGRKSFCSSALVRMANAGSAVTEWCGQLKRWVYAGHVELPGLVKRREAEYGLCVS